MRAILRENADLSALLLEVVFAFFSIAFDQGRNESAFERMVLQTH